MTASNLRVLVIGAHPDDADLKAGGTAAKWTACGATVELVSLTDGSAGHQSDAGPGMARRRRAEAKAAGAVIGATYQVFDIPDGTLDDRLEYRQRVIRHIRSFRPDVIITHRTVDYHPDHRFAGLLVQDSAYLLTVPAVCPDVPHLERMPVILYFSDGFKKPCRFEPHLVVDTTDTFAQQLNMLDQHASQFYEWLPYNAGNLDQVPSGAEARRAWLAGRFGKRIEPLTRRYRDLIEQTYGADKAAAVRFVEAFEVSEYGAPLDAEARRRLFPFLPEAAQGSGFARKEWLDLPEDD